MFNVYILHFYVTHLIGNSYLFFTDKLTGDPNQPTQPLVRVRIEYIDDRQTLSVGRFGNHFMDRIANPADILIFKKMTKAKMEKAGVDFSDQQMQEIAGNCRIRSPQSYCKNTIG